MKMRSFLNGMVLTISTAIIMTSCYKSKSSYNSNPGSYKIMMKNSAFSPASLTVVAGSTVTWMNDDTVIHSVKAADGSLNSGDIAIGSSYSKAFSTTGTINYSDSHNSNMTGVLIIAASSGGGY